VNAAIIKRGTRYAVRLNLGRGPDGKGIYRYSLRLPTKRAANKPAPSCRGP
jgi:hypothetical protein